MTNLFFLILFFLLAASTTAPPPPPPSFDRRPLLLPLSFSSARIADVSELKLRRHLHGVSPNARMRLYDDLLSNGYYTTRLWIGTPAQEFALIVDTGSTVTYVPCNSCDQCGNHQDPKFQPDLSNTYHPVKCNPDCTCDAENDQCTYERQYAEMSSSSGILGEDLVSFGNMSELKPQRAVFGCENAETGDLFSQHADGIMGLGRGDLSIVDQLVDKGVINDSFSLCYGGMEVGGGAMVLGQISPPSDMVFSHSDPDRSPYYNIELRGLQVAGKKLDINPQVFDGKHGTILDSGTTYAYLPEAAFLPFIQAITRELHDLKQIRGPDPNYNDVCFSGAGSEIPELYKTFPSVDMVFENGEKYSLSPENYLFKHSKVPGAYCLGVFQNGKDPTTLLGGIVVRNTLVTYDREHSKVGFWKTNCSVLWERLNASNISPAPAPLGGEVAATDISPAPLSGEISDTGRAPAPLGEEVSNTGMPPAPLGGEVSDTGTGIGMPPAPLGVEVSATGIPATTPNGAPSHLISGDFQVGYITFVISLSVKYLDLKPHVSELSRSIAKELGVNVSQVQLLNMTSAGNGSLISCSIYPEGSAKYFSNTTATHIISRLAEVQLPESFGSYKLVNWKVQPPLKKSWRQQHYLVVFMAILITLMLGLSAYGIWFVWRWRQEATIPYKPVSSDAAPVIEQELQPL